MYIVEGLSYGKSCDIIKELNEIGISAEIIVGGIGVYTKTFDQETTFLRFANENNLHIQQNTSTSMKQNVTFCTK